MKKGLLAALGMLLLAAFPGILGLIANASTGYKLNDAGRGVPVRPPGWVFGLCWFVIYVCLGESWVLSWRADRAGQALTHTVFSALTIVLAAWIVVYAKKGAMAAMYVMIMSIVLSVMAALLASRRRTLAGILVAPLVGWLVFASILNAEEVNRGA